ncbi:GAF domain-containing protein [Specibacter sp. AOP5-B1-6]|uniref:GAF domain-containing protein n=1 Tax=Specibacter sp. AOP5-B1-6 TaxID=3457653 RepID=UPI00402B48B9
MTTPPDAAATEGAVLTALANGTSMAELRMMLSTAAPQFANDAVLVRQQLDDLAERERNLVQLVESSRELAGLDAVDSVLSAIVARSRRLLMSDVAYFLKFEQESGLSRMITSEGILSDDFARLVVPRNEGISGFIAASRKPSWTRDYLNDVRYSHNNTIDTATVDEGLRAILGVPVLRNGRVVGLLLAADRRVHDYRPQDVELLFSLAQYAGVAIENATVHEAGRQTVEHLQGALDSLESSEIATHSIMDFQDRLLGILMTNGSLGDLAELVQASIGGTVVVEDDGGRLLARSGPDAQPGPTGPNAADALWNVEPLGHQGPPVGTLKHLPAGNTILEGPSPSAEQRQILGRAATVAALLITKLQSELTTARARNAAMVMEWLEDPGGALERNPGAASGLGHLNTALVLQVEESSTPALLRLVQQKVERTGGMACNYRGSVLLWMPAAEPGTVAGQYALSMTGAIGQPVTAGAAVVAAPQALAAAATTAHNTVRALVALGRGGTGSLSNAVAPFPSILSNSSPAELTEFVHSVLGTLLDYDSRHGSELVATLKTVYANSSNASSAADTLLVHPNTVQQRLARIDQITSESWRDSDVTMRRQLALKVLDLMGPDAAAASTSKGTAS